MVGPVLAGLEAAGVVTASAIRHASWWLEWHARVGPDSGSRDVADVELQPCESS